MNISPNSTIRILKNVPLDNTYTDTILFDNATDQTTHFASYTNKTFNQQTYQRVNKNRLRVQICADEIYDYNYLMFRNTAFGTKWFYAFITSVEYINNITSEVEYEIDDMQTWLFDYTLRPCFVEREHSATDDNTDGELIKPEPIDIGDIICDNMSNKDLISTYGVLVGYTDLQLGNIGQKIGSNLFSGCEYRFFDFLSAQDMHDLKQMLGSYSANNHEDMIKFLKVVPKNFINDTVNESGDYIGVKGHTVTFAKPTTLMNNGYAPRNKKLLYYPYNFFNVDTCDDDRNYRYEWFNGRDGLCRFRLIGVLNEDFCIYVAPEGYNGSNIDDTPPETFPPTPFMNPSESVTSKGFPYCSWRAGGIEQDLVNSFKQGVKNATSGIVYGAVTGKSSIMGLGLASAVSNVVDIATLNSSSSLKGTSGTSLEVALNLKAVYFKNMSITLPRAKMIDDYFERYGYACGEIKVPNRDVRPHWCYTKTNDCNIIGSIPVDSMKHIKSIYNNGITWWKNGNEVGDYTLDNRV